MKAPKWALNQDTGNGVALSTKRYSLFLYACPKEKETIRLQMVDSRSGAQLMDLKLVRDGHLLMSNKGSEKEGGLLTLTPDLDTPRVRYRVAMFLFRGEWCLEIVREENSVCRLCARVPAPSGVAKLCQWKLENLSVGF